MAIRLLEIQLKRVATLDNGMPTASAVKNWSDCLQDLNKRQRDALVKGDTDIDVSHKMYKERLNIDENLASAVMAHAAVLFPIAIRHQVQLSASLAVLVDKMYKHGEMPHERAALDRLIKATRTSSEPRAAPSTSTHIAPDRGPRIGACKFCRSSLEKPPPCPADAPGCCDCCEQVVPSGWVSSVPLSETSSISLCRFCKERVSSIKGSDSLCRSLQRRHGEREWIRKLSSISAVIADKLSRLHNGRRWLCPPSQLEWSDQLKQAKAYSTEEYQTQVKMIRDGGSSLEERQQAYRCQMQLDKSLVIALAIHVLRLITLARLHSVKFLPSTSNKLAELLEFLEGLDPARWGPPL